MYEDIKLSPRYKNKTKTFVNAAIDSFNEKVEASKPQKSPYTPNFSTEANIVLEMTALREANINKYHTFAASVRASILSEALMHIFENCMSENILKKDNTSRNIMRAIVSEYVNENGYEEIMNRMKKASTYTSTLYNIISEASTEVLNNVDKTDSSTFKIEPEMKDEFFKQLNYSDSQAISDAIKERVADEVEDFVVSNRKDHEDITAALQSAQEKIDTISPNDPDEEEVTNSDSNSLREYYQMKAKRTVNEIKNAPKGVFHSMVSSMCESVLKNKESHAEFLNENNGLNMNKIVNRINIMYTFMEMLNTTRIDPMNETYIEDIIRDLSK